MIAIKKSKIPQVLADNAERWTSLYCTSQRDHVATKYNHPDIKQALRKETFDKCAYCESKVTHIDHGDIEHILPKSKRPDLCFEWSNLTFACTKCNRPPGKGDYYNEDYPLINPYIDDPDKHFYAAWSSIIIHAGDERAKITEQILKLNRPELVEKRLERIQYVELLLSAWRKLEPSHPGKNIAEGELHNEYKRDKEYSFAVRGYLMLQGFPVR